MRDFEGGVVLVSHDQYFVSRVAREVFVVGGGKVTRAESFDAYRKGDREADGGDGWTKKGVRQRRGSSGWWVCAESGEGMIGNDSDDSDDDIRARDVCRFVCYYVAGGSKR